MVTGDPALFSDGAQGPGACPASEGEGAPGDLLALLFEHAGDLVLVVDEEGRALRASRSWEALLGGSEGARPEKAPDLLSKVVEKDRSLVRGALTGAVHRGTGSTVGFRVALPDGTLRRLEGRWDPLPGRDGRPTRALVVARDVTDRDVRDRRPASEGPRPFRGGVEPPVEDLADSRETRTELLANMTHELRTPMNSILGFSELLLTGPPVDSDEGRVFVKLVHEAGQRLMRLIDDLLDLARIEAGHLVLQKRDFCLREMLETIIDRLASMASRGEVEVRLAEDEVGLCHADPPRMRQVCVGLISSAIRLTPPGGVVEISASRERGRVHLAVQDGGDVLSPEDCERIFQAFEQVTSRATGGRRGGHGVGLAITREIVQAHGGELSVRPAGERGNRFVVSLPQ